MFTSTCKSEFRTMALNKSQKLWLSIILVCVSVLSASSLHRLYRYRLDAIDREAKLRYEKCKKELHLFRASHGVHESQIEILDPAVLLTTMALSESAFDRVYDNSLETLTSGFIPEEYLSLVLFNAFIGNNSLEDLARIGVVNPLLSAFTSASASVTFIKLDNDTFVVIDAIGRSIVVRDSHTVICNTRIMIADAPLLPAKRLQDVSLLRSGIKSPVKGYTPYEILKTDPKSVRLKLLFEAFDPWVHVHPTDEAMLELYGHV